MQTKVMQTKVEGDVCLDRNAVRKTTSCFSSTTFGGTENYCDLAGAVFDACSIAGGLGWAREPRGHDEREVDQYGVG